MIDSKKWNFATSSHFGHVWSQRVTDWEDVKLIRWTGDIEKILWGSCDWTTTRPSAWLTWRALRAEGARSQPLNLRSF